MPALTLAVARAVGWVSCPETCRATTPKRGCLAARGRAAALVNVNVPKPAQIYKAPAREGPGWSPRRQAAAWLRAAPGRGLGKQGEKLGTVLRAVLADLHPRKCPAHKCWSCGAIPQSSLCWYPPTKSLRIPRAQIKKRNIIHGYRSGRVFVQLLGRNNNIKKPFL